MGGADRLDQAQDAGITRFAEHLVEQAMAEAENCRRPAVLLDAEDHSITLGVEDEDGDVEGVSIALGRCGPDPTASIMRAAQRVSVRHGLPLPLIVHAAPNCRDSLSETLQ